MVVGSRFVERSEGFQSTGLRRQGIKWLHGCIKLACGLDIADPTSGFRASGTRAIELFAQRYPSDYPEPESIVVARRAGLAVAEVPVEMRERMAGASSINILRGAYYMIKVSLAVLIAGMERGR